MGNIQTHFVWKIIFKLDVYLFRGGHVSTEQLFSTHTNSEESKIFVFSDVFTDVFFHIHSWTYLKEFCLQPVTGNKSEIIITPLSDLQGNWLLLLKLASWQESHKTQIEIDNNVLYRVFPPCTPQASQVWQPLTS